MSEAKSTRHLAKPLRHAWMVALWLFLGAGYVVASASGLRVIVTLIVCLMIGALLVATGRLWAGCLTGISLAGMCTYFSDSMYFIMYAPPLVAFAFMAHFFYRTLRPGSEPLITRIARKEHPDLPLDMERHTRMLTWLWSVCFMFLFAVSLLLALVLVPDAWSRWVNGLGYILPASLFLGEYAYRHYRFRGRKHSSLVVLILNSVSVIREAALSAGHQDAETVR